MSTSIRPQAGPLPPKRGEIGYQEALHGPQQPDAQSSTAALQSLPTLPARHPADRLYAGTPASSTTNVTTRPPSPSVSDTSANSKHSLISFLAPKNVPTIGGLRLTTLTRFIVQLLLIAGTVVGWVLVVRHMSSGSSNESDRGNNGGGGVNNATLNNASQLIFVHVAFIFALLLELVFAERTLFRLRAERYCYVHPGEILPSAVTRRRAHGRFGVAFKPWNRVSLPTYAAALAQSGVRTGDVEDNAIAILPPPAYGSERDSTLLLSGSRTATLSAPQRLSQVVEEEVQETRQVHGPGERSRPLSYMSQDPAWDEVVDADRARRLEEVLAQIEERDVTEAARPRQVSQSSHAAS